MTEPTTDTEVVDQAAVAEAIPAARPPARQGRALALGLLGFWLFHALVLAGLSYVDLRHGRQAVDRARQTDDPGELAAGKPLPALRDARAAFSRGHDKLTNPLVAPLKIVPVLGRQVRSASALAGAATEVSDAGVDAVIESQRVLELPRSSGTERIALMRRMAGLADRTHRRISDLSYGPRVGLLGPLANARNDLASEVRDLDVGLVKASAAADAAVTLFTGPRRYLVLAANNSEMRAGSGMFLLVGELQAGDGTLHLGDMGPVDDSPVPEGKVPLAGDLAARWGWAKPNVQWKNLMTSPRFDQAAPLAAQMWEAAGHQKVDGVLALDAIALRVVLDATGPVSAGGKTVGADTVVQQLLHDQYLQFSEDDRAKRQDALGGIASSAFDALNAGGWSPSRLADGLASAARGRHVMAWSSRPVEQRGWRAAGIDGSLRADSMLVAVMNRGANKLDWFLQTESELRLVPSGRDTKAELRVHIKNAVPDGQPKYIAGRNKDGTVPRNVYPGLLAVSLPGVARDPVFDGVAKLDVAGRDGPTVVVGFPFDLQRDEERTVVLRFLLPGEDGTIRVEPSGRVQPVRWSSGGRRWTDETAHSVRW